MLTWSGGEACPGGLSLGLTLPCLSQWWQGVCPATQESHAFWDNSQNLGFGCAPSSFIPTLCRRSEIWSRHHQRFMTATETLLAQGVPVIRHPLVKHLCPWMHVMDSDALSAHSLKERAGNGMHAGVVGPLCMYVLSNVRIVQPVHPERPIMTIAEVLNQLCLHVFGLWPNGTSKHAESACVCDSDDGAAVGAAKRIRSGGDEDGAAA